MKWILFYICFVSISLGHSLRFYRLAFLPYGALVDPTIFCYDSNHNGKGELIFNTPGIGDIGGTQWIWMIYEYVGYDAYEPFHQVYVNRGPAFRICGIGDFDKDGCTDMVGRRGDPVHPDTCFRFPLGELTIFESPHPDSYPTSLSPWYDTTPSCMIQAPGDLDGDGREEILVSRPTAHDTEGVWRQDTFMIYENTGNNEYERVFIHPLASPYYSQWVFGDFDQDGKIELIDTNVYEILTIYENVGDNRYKKVWQDSSLNLHPKDIFSSKDTDSDGKPEFFTTLYRDIVSGMFYLYKWEAIGDNLYKSTFIDAASFKPCNGPVVRSKCGDLDGDGIEEIVWSIATHVYVYKAVGDDEYERVWEWENDHTKKCMGIVGAFVDLYDFNKNGYPEIIISGYNKTSVFELDTTYGIASKPSISQSPNLSISPNPCKGVASIEYQVASRGPISIEIYNACGRLVRTFAKAQSPEPKAYTIEWDGRDENGEPLPAGIYFLKLKTASHALTKKVVLMR